MSNGEYEWVPEKPSVKQRVVAGALLIALLVSFASDVAGWGLFGGHDRQVAAAVTILTLFVFARFMPSARRRS